MVITGIQLLRETDWTGLTAQMVAFQLFAIRDAASKFRVKDDVAQGHAADWYLKGAASYYIAGQTNQLCAA